MVGQVGLLPRQREKAGFPVAGGPAWLSERIAVKAKRPYSSFAQILDNS